MVSPRVSGVGLTRFGKHPEPTGRDDNAVPNEYAQMRRDIAVADFGLVRLTGIMPDVDSPDVETGIVVGLGVRDGSRPATGY